MLKHTTAALYYCILFCIATSPIPSTTALSVCQSVRLSPFPAKITSGYCRPLLRTDNAVCPSVSFLMDSTADRTVVGGDDGYLHLLCTSKVFRFETYSSALSASLCDPFGGILGPLSASDSSRLNPHHTSEGLCRDQCTAPPFSRPRFGRWYSRRHQDSIAEYPLTEEINPREKMAENTSAEDKLLLKTAYPSVLC